MTSPPATAEWHLCCSNTSPDALRFIIMCVISLAVLSFCLYELAAKPESNDRAIYWSMLSTIVSIWVPSPSLGVELPRNTFASLDETKTST